MKRMDRFIEGSGITSSDSHLPIPTFINGHNTSQEPTPLSLLGGGMTSFCGRVSPGHDLGYHTLLTRPATSDSRQTPPVLEGHSWTSDIPSVQSSTPLPCEGTTVSPASSRPPSAVSRGTSDTERLVITTTFKRKKAPRTSPFEKLSDDLILRVFSFLSSNQLCVCARVCRRWYFLAWEPQLWTSVTLSGDKVHVDRGLKTLFRLLCRDSPAVCLTVERIALSGCSRLSDKGLATVAARCPELRTLEVRGCANVTDRGLSDVLSRCHNLERLDVTGCSPITCVQPSATAPDPTGASSSGQQLYLQYLDLTDCQNLEDSGLQQVVRLCPQLSHLYLRRCSRVTDVGLKSVASYCGLLRELSVSDCILVTDFGLYELAKLGPNLRYLSVAKCDQVSDAGIKQIARHCYKLRYLNVRGCEAVSDDSMEVIARSCPRLRALDIGKCDVTDNGLKIISQNCPNLRKLSVKSCEMITDNGIQIIAYYCRGLQQLNIQDCHISLNGYRTVKKFCKRCIIEHTNPGFS